MFEDFKKFAGNLFNRKEDEDNYFDLSQLDEEMFTTSSLNEDNPTIASSYNTMQKW